MDVTINLFKSIRLFLFQRVSFANWWQNFFLRFVSFRNNISDYSQELFQTWTRRTTTGLWKQWRARSSRMRHTIIIKKVETLLWTLCRTISTMEIAVVKDVQKSQIVRLIIKLFDKIFNEFSFRFVDNSFEDRWKEVER